MIGDETDMQIKQFLDELRKWLKTNKPEGDFRWLYDKYPKVRICIRRAILFVNSEA